MIENLPTYVKMIFGLTAVVTLILFTWTISKSASEATRRNSILIFAVLSIWLVFQALLTTNEVYITDINSFPPKILLIGVLPALLSIILLFATSTGRRFVDSLPLKNLNYINTIRIPVEIVLYWLFLNKMIPELMTFEGRNFDILAGITAPFIAYFGFSKPRISRNVILIWNFVSLGLLINIIVLAVLSGPSPIQKFAFEQPNIAIFYFPFSWLPTFIVPVVLFGHLTSIRQLLIRK